MRWIYLGTKNEKEYFTCVDDESFEIVKDLLWVLSNDGYAKCVHANDLSFMHRKILNLTRNEMVKFLNGNILDNRKENLIRRTEYYDSVGKNGDGVQKLNGDIFSARLCVNGKLNSLGTFSTQLEARAAYIGACRILNLQINDIPIPPIIEPTYDEKREAIAFRYLLLKKKHEESLRRKAEKKIKPVMNEKGETFESMEAAAKAYGRYTTSTLKNHINGQLKTCWGTKWKIISKLELEPKNTEEP